ncbi:MAG: site-specific integrase [Pirellulales bacterium]|nr:site-specific integrase [Pirellulales bacterium]
MIRVNVRWRPDRGLFQLYFRHPLTGKRVMKSAGTDNRREAERAAARWQAELERSNLGENKNVSWDAFRLQFEERHLLQLARGSRTAYRVSLNHFEKLIGQPTNIRMISAGHLSEFSTKLLAKSKSRVTVGKILRHLRVALGWAEKMGMLDSVPRFSMPSMRGVNVMKGRPITEAEFALLLAAVPTVRPNDPETWTQLLLGLWLSGLRLGEACRLAWDKPPIMVDLASGKYPRLIFRASGQKSGKEELVPITPEFAEFLKKTPANKRTGKVFSSVTRAGRIISEIGEEAGVVVNEHGKFASAHDLRRAFGTRLSLRVRPVILQKIMRHASIHTTLKYYVDQDADDLGAELWAKR